MSSKHGHKRSSGTTLRKLLVDLLNLFLLYQICQSMRRYFCIRCKKVWNLLTSNAKISSHALTDLILLSYENLFLLSKKKKLSTFSITKIIFSCDQSIRSVRAWKCSSMIVSSINNQALWQIWVPFHVNFWFQTWKS